MTRWPHYLTFAAGIGFIAVVLSLTAAQPAVAQKGGSAPITIAGPLPLPVQEAGTPFQAELCIQQAGGCVAPNSLTVPQDARIVIEFVSGLCNEVNAVALTTTAASNVASHLLLLEPRPGLTGNFTISQMTRIYADAGTAINLVAAFSAPVGGCGNVFLSGYTIPVPSV